MTAANQQSTIGNQQFLAWHWNGERFASGDGVPLSDRGFRYGMSLFESLRVTRGEAEFFDEHLSRLLTACGERDFAISEEALRAAEALWREEKVSGFARIYVTAGDGDLTARAERPRVYLVLEERATPDPDNPWELTLHEESCRPLFGGAKTGNYWWNAEALATARRKSFDEALLFNDFGELVSACTGNVFLVHDDHVSTPARSSGCRLGVIRDWVIKRRSAKECRLKREEVLSADEIFVTNSWIGVMPAATLEGRPLARRYVGPKLAGELAQRRA